MEPQRVEPVKLIIGILYVNESSLDKVLEKLAEKYGKIDYKSPVYDFDVTDYYCTEMGMPIFRIFISHQQLIYPNQIAPIKIECNEIENLFAQAGNRKINLDPGYMDYDKFVLASAKYNGQKVYLDRGIYADLTLRYERGQYFPFPWSFPDFKSGLYDAAFLMMRARYKGQRRKAARVN